MLKNPNFPGLRPGPHCGELTGRAYIAPLDVLGGEGTRCPFPNNPTPVLGPSIRPRFYRSQGQTHYKVVNRKYMIIIHNNAFLLASLVFLILKRLQFPT